MQERATKVLHKRVPQECPMEAKAGVRTECHAKWLHKMPYKSIMASGSLRCSSCIALEFVRTSLLKRLPPFHVKGRVPCRVPFHVV